MALRTATNPKTGQRLALINGQWVPFTQSATNPKTGQKAVLVNGRWIVDGQTPAPAPAAPKPEESGFFRQVLDVPVQAVGGIATGVRLITDAFGADNAVSQGIRGAENYLQSLLSAQAKNDQQEVARIMKEAQDKGVADQVIAGLKAFAVAPVDTIAQAAGTAVPVIVGGLAGAALRAPAVIGLAGTGAAMGAGTVKSSIYDATYQVLREKGVSEVEAKKVAAQAQEYSGENLDQILLGTALGGVAGRIGVEPAVARQVANEIAKRAVIKTAAKEAGTEFAQAGQEQLAQNIALQRQGYDVPTMRGVIGAGTLEAVAGAGLGAGIEFAGREPPTAAAPPPPAATTVAPPPAAPTKPTVTPTEPTTPDELLEAEPRVPAELAPQNIRYLPTTLSEEDADAELTKMEQMQEQLADLLFDNDQIELQARRANLPIDQYKTNLRQEFDDLTTKIDVFYKHLDGTLLPVKPAITQEQVVAAGVSPDVAKALNVNVPPVPTTPAVAPGGIDVTAAAAPPITQPPVSGAVAGGVSVPPSGPITARPVPTEPVVEGMEPAARPAGDVVPREEIVQPALERRTFEQRVPVVDEVGTEIAARKVKRQEAIEIAKANAESAFADQTSFQNLNESIGAYQDNVRDTLQEYGLDEHTDAAIAAYDVEIKKLTEAKKPRTFEQRGVFRDEFSPTRYAKVKTSKGMRTIEVQRETPDGTIIGYRVNAKDGSRWFDPKVEGQGIDRQEMVVVPKTNIVEELRQSLYYGDLRPEPRTFEQRKLTPSVEPIKEDYVLWSTASDDVSAAFPDGPFTDAESNVVKAEGVDPRFQGLLKGLMDQLGLNDVRVFIATKKDIFSKGETYSEAIDRVKRQYGLTGEYAINGILEQARSDKTEGALRQFGSGYKDFVLMYDSTMNFNRIVEAIGHELGHIVEKVAYEDASPDVRREIRSEFENWYRENKGKTAKEIVLATRNRLTSEQAVVLPPGYRFFGEELEYWTSFSEWFADNVSKWVTTDKKPMTVVQRFFADVARKIRRLVAGLTGNKFVPNKAVANFLNKMGPVDARQWTLRETAPNSGTNYMFNAVGNTVKKLPKLNSRIYDSVRNILDSTRISDNIRSGIYAFMSLPQQVELFAKELPSLKSLLNVLNVRASALKGRKEVLDRNVRKWTKRIQGHSADVRAKFYEIAHESTRLQVKFKAADYNKHPFREEAEQLRKEFDRLPSDLQDTYWEMLDSYKSMSNDYIKLLSRNLSKRATRRLEREMAKQRLEVYLPLFRQGDYWLRYQDAKNDTVVMAFDSNRERELAWEEAEKNGAKSKEVFFKLDNLFKQKETGPFFNKIMEELESRGASEATKRALYQLYLDQIPMQSVRQQYKTRARDDGSYGYKGYDTDLINVYATVASRMANQLTNLEYIPEIDKVYSDIIEESKKEAAQAKSTAVGKLMENLRLQMDYLRDPGNSNIVNALSSFSYYWYIIGNVSTAVINMTQVPMVVFPYLAGKYGGTETSKSLSDAYQQYFKGGWDNDDVPGGEKKFPSDYSFGINLPPGSPLAKLYEAAVRQSAIRRSTGYDVIQGRKKTYGVDDYVGLKAKTEQILGWVFQNSERFNREVTLIAAFNLEMKKNGGDVNRAIEVAIDAINMTHGVTLTETSPRVFQTGFGKVAFTFKNFAQTMIYLQAKLLRDAVKGESKEVKKLAAKQLLGISAMAFIFAGVQGMPFYGAATVMANLLQDMFGDDDEPFDANTEVRRSLSAIPFKGVVNELLQQDIASRTGFTNLLWRDDDKRVEEVGPFLYAMEQLFGPSYAAAMSMYRGYNDWKDGYTDRAVEAVMPAFIRNNLKAYRYLTEGALTRDKKLIYDDFSEYELFMQALGFTPVEVSRRSEIAGGRAKLLYDIKQRKDALLDRLYLAVIAKDKEGIKEAREAIAKYNKSEIVTKLGERITDTTMQNSLRTRRTRAARSTYGIYTPPRAARGLAEIEPEVEKKD